MRGKKMFSVTEVIDRLFADEGSVFEPHLENVCAIVISEARKISEQEEQKNESETTTTMMIIILHCLLIWAFFF